MISVVIPTLNEAGAIEEALRRSAAALRRLGVKFELIVVDDASSDGTAERAEALVHEVPVRILRRAGKRGLATAVVDGWAMAEGDVLGVMDADLQHPPEILAELAEAIERSGADLAMASRYVGSGGSHDWSLTRRLVSRAATHLAATALPRKLAGVTDPMSGMFMVRAEAVRGVRLNPMGYKILVEVLGKGRVRKIIEVPFQFEARTRGTSKLGMSQYAQYLAHLASLARSTGQMQAWLRYALVGVTGAAVEIFLMMAAIKLLGWSPLGALPVAIELALIWNFFGNRSFTFSDVASAFRLTDVGLRPGDTAQCSPRNGATMRHLTRYELICLPGAVLNGGSAVYLLAHHFALPWAIAAGILADGAFNLIFNVPSIWKIWDSPAPK